MVLGVGPCQESTALILRSLHSPRTHPGVWHQPPGLSVASCLGFCELLESQGQGYSSCLPLPGHSVHAMGALWLARPHQDCRGLKGARSAQLSSPIGPCRVRSIIMLQEKAQDRERLLLKFIKIMKVTAAPSPEPAPSGPASGRRAAPGLPALPP